MEYENHNGMKVVHAIPPAALAADASSAVIDTLGFESLEWVLHVGTAMVGGGFAVTLFESDVVTFGGEETAVPAANIVGTLPDVIITDANKVFRVGSVGKKRFQQLRLTETGTITGGVIGVTAILGHPKTQPTAAQNT